MKLPFSNAYAIIIKDWQNRAAVRYSWFRRGKGSQLLHIINRFWINDGNSGMIIHYNKESQIIYIALINSFCTLLSKSASFLLFPKDGFVLTQTLICFNTKAQVLFILSIDESLCPPSTHIYSVQQIIIEWINEWNASEPRPRSKTLEWKS